jgi:hypothetical protein
MMKKEMGVRLETITQINALSLWRSNAKRERYMQRLQDIYGYDQEKLKILEDKLLKELYDYYRKLKQKDD